MLDRRALATIALLSALFVCACAVEDAPVLDPNASPDGENAVGIDAGKADGPFSECELAMAVEFCNDPATTLEVLIQAGVHRRASENIVAYRAGADGELNTADDEVFDDAHELDSVYYVGPAAFRQLVEHVQERCSSPDIGSAPAEVIFSPQPFEASHLVRVAALIDQANISVDIAMYSFSDSGIKAALDRAVERGVTVRMIFEPAKDHRKDPAGTTSASLEDLGIDVRYINKIMHHKFAIIDGPYGGVGTGEGGVLVTGSANWSRSAATRYNENTIIVRGHMEALFRYQREFNLMWNYSRDFEWNPDLVWYPSPVIEDQDIPDVEGFDAVFTSANFKLKQTSYGPTFTVIAGENAASDRLVQLIWSATTSIHVASGHLRSRPVSEALIAKAAAEPWLDIRVYLDGQEYISSWYHSQQSQELEGCLADAGDSLSKQQKCMDRGFLFGYALHLANVDVRYKYYTYRWHYSYSPQMHHKYMVIDGRTLASGSYNLSDNAEHNTLENIGIYSGGGFAALVQSFEDEFERMWTTGEAEGYYAILFDTIETATDGFPIVFDAMALDWDQVTKLKALIKANCPAINSEAYRKHPESHMWCEF